MESRISLITLGVADVARSIRFYRDGLGFATTAREGDPIAFSATAGTRLAVYPLDKLAEDIGPGVRPSSPGFSGITLAHNVRRKEDVAGVLALAARSGGRIVKEAQDVFWGGYNGYFEDPDGHYWEVAWAEQFRFDETGSLIL